MHQGTSSLLDANGNPLLDASGVAIKRAFGLCLYQLQAIADAEFSI
jgi:hypothetical protein